MGMTIDEAITHIMDVICENNTIKHSDLVVFNNEKQALRTAIDTMRKYQMLQADYNARLKADMVAMLTDLDLQIDESAAYNLEVAKVQRLIRDRINKLKSESEDKE